MIEIGPGRGALTRHLLPKTDELHAIEIDGQLVHYLEQKFADEPKLRVQRGDVLKTDLAQWGPAVITGNLPYYITSPIIEQFVQLGPQFSSAVFLMQWEVAERLLAPPGTRDFGYLTVATRLACDVELVAKVPPAAFVPPPKVDSAALLFRRRADTPHNLPEILQFISRCFTQKRKTLRNNLRGSYGAAADKLPEAGLRAEQLTIPQFLDVYSRLRASGSVEQGRLYTESS